MVPTGSYDALLVVSFGGPEGPDEVMPFLENVTSGRGIPRERLAAVAEHYHGFGGVSPINKQCRDLIAAIESDLAATGLDLPVYWGNRNWHPFLADTLTRMADDGVSRALAFVTGAYSSYSSCRQYREDIAAARARVGPRAPLVDKLRHYFNHPGFINPMADNTRHALDRLAPDVRDGAHLVFTAHSIPAAMADASGPNGGDYARQLREASRLVAERVAGQRPWELVYQSRSGAPSQPWLEPDVCDYLEELGAKGVDAAVLVPIGFISDHLEVAYDLDIEAAGTARQLGMPLTRAATVGDDPRFAGLVRELVRERTEGQAPRAALGELGPSHDVCPLSCCPNPRGPRPTVASTGS